MRSRRIFTSLNSSKHVPIAKTRSHRFWWEWNLSKHVPVAKYLFVSLLTAWISNVIVRCHVLVYLGGPQVLKRSEIYQELDFLQWRKSLCWNHVPIAFGMITICQNTFPSLLPLFGDGNVFWRIENAGNTGKLSLKTRSHRKNCTKKPPNSLKTLPRAWKMVPQSDSPMGEHFSGALVDFPWQTEVK